MRAYVQLKRCVRDCNRRAPRPPPPRCPPSLLTKPLSARPYLPDQYFSSATGGCENRRKCANQAEYLAIKDILDEGTCTKQPTCGGKQASLPAMVTQCPPGALLPKPQSPAAPRQRQRVAHGTAWPCLPSNLTHTSPCAYAAPVVMNAAEDEFLSTTEPGLEKGL